MNGPDLAGFKAAFERKRAAMGVDIAFFGKSENTYPPGTALKADGRPVDGFVQPLSSDTPETTVRCEVVYRPAGEGGGAEAGPIGWMDRAHVMVIANDTEQATLEGSVGFLLNGDMFDIIGTHLDEPVRGADRMLVFGRKR